MNNAQIDSKALELIKGVEVTDENRWNWRRLAYEIAEKAIALLDAGWSRLDKDTLFATVLFQTATKLSLKPDPWIDVFVDGKSIGYHKSMFIARNVELYGKPDEYTSSVEYFVAGMNVKREFYFKIFLAGFEKLYFETIESTPARGFSGSQQRYSVHHRAPNPEADAWEQKTSYGSFTGGSGSTVSYKFIKGE